VGQRSMFKNQSSWFESSLFTDRVREFVGQRTMFELEVHGSSSIVRGPRVEFESSWVKERCSKLEVQGSRVDVRSGSY